MNIFVYKNRLPGYPWVLLVKMSDDESRSTDMSSDDSDMTLNSVQFNMEEITDVINAFNVEICELEKQLETIQRPMEALALNQLGDIQFHESSPFRHHTFKVQIGIPGIDISKRYPFHEICTIVRNYLFETGSVNSDGTIKLTKQLQKLFGIKESVTTYLNVLKHLRKVLV